MTKKAIEVNRPSFQLRKQGRLGFFFGQGPCTVLALFHNELVERGIDWQGIIPVKTSEAEGV